MTIYKDRILKVCLPAPPSVGTGAGGQGTRLFVLPIQTLHLIPLQSRWGEELMSDTERPLGFKFWIDPSNSKVVRGLVRRHTTNDRPMKRLVAAFEGPLLPHAQQLGGKKSVKITIRRQLVILTSGD